jgi:peptidoglycan/LPS O-acetylase OafA/YrhL
MNTADRSASYSSGVPYCEAPLAPRSQLKALTTLRFFAALHVVLFHMWVTGELAVGPCWYQNFASIGYVGVNCFFVLSGFILVYTYTDPLLDAPRFWQARLARIYPAYALSLVLSAPFFFHAVRYLHIPFYSWSSHHLFSACILTVLLLQAWIPQGALSWNSVCWSLSVEAFFYLLFPALLVWCRRRSPAHLLAWITACGLLSLGLSLFYIVVHPDGADKVNSPETTLFWKNVLSFNPVARLPEFLTGMLAGQIFLRVKLSGTLALPLVLGGSLVVATLTVLVGTVPTPLISAGFLSPAFAAIIFGFALRPKWVSVLEARWLLLLGDASYSLYLLHSVVITRVYDGLAFSPQWLRVAVALAAAIAAALLCFLFLEKPARNLLRPKARQAAVAAR